MQVSSAPFVNSGAVYNNIKQTSSVERRKQEHPIKTQGATDFSHSPNEESILVSGYEVHGNTLLSGDEITNTLKPFYGQTLTMSQIHNAANVLSTYYHKKGYFAAKVFVPPQPVYNGFIIFQVYEGYLEEDGIKLSNSGERIDDSVVSDILNSTLTKGGHITRAEFERAILLVNDLSGISSHATLYPGKEVGTSDFLLKTVDEAKVMGNIDYDNFGGYYTGEHRLGTTVYVNSPFNKGEQVTLRFVTSGEDSNYGYVNYTTPVSGNGLHVGASIDYLKYKLDKAYRVLDNQGYASDARVFVTYPFVRSRHFNVIGKADYSFLRLKDYNNTGTQSDKVIHSAVFQLSGDYDDDYSPGITYFDTSLTLGTVDLDNDMAFKNLDAAAADTQGNFSKVNLEVSRLQSLPGNFSTYASLSGQLSSKNLDTSQKFFVGGPYGVLGYQAGEFSGDNAIQLHLDLRYDFYNLPWGGDLQLSTIYSYAKVKFHKDTWAGWDDHLSNLGTNVVSIQSVGLALNQSWEDEAVLRGMIGWPIGNDDELFSGSSDKSDDFSVWLNTIFYF